MHTAHVLLVASILLPSLASLLIRSLDQYENRREAVSIGTAILTFIAVVSLYATVKQDIVPELVLWAPFPGVSIALEAEPVGLLFALMASFLWIVTSIYAIGYMRGHGEQNQTRFYFFFAIAIASALGIAFSANGFTLFLFYEILTLSTFPLVTHAGDNTSKRAGRVYLFILLGTSISLLLLALIWTWTLTGTLDFRAGGIFDDEVSRTVLGILFGLYIFGIGKAALMPFHRWLPAAMVAPTPVSALLHAVAVVKAGVFSVIKISVYIFGIDLVAELPSQRVLAYAAAFTIVASAVVAFRKDNLKARLAYSTIGQLSYIVLGTLTANLWGVIGGGMHMLMHGFGKITLFFGAGAIMVAAHKTEISEMRGIGRQMPVTLIAFLIGCLAIIGLPPTGGMWSKVYLLLGAFAADDWILLLVFVLGTLLSIAYLMPFVIRAFRANPDLSGEIKEAPLPIRIAMIISAGGCLYLFFNPNFAYDLMQAALTQAS